MNFKALVKNDFRLSFRYGFFTVYTAVSVLYAVAVHFIPGEIQKTFLTLLIYTDPAILGLFFIGGVLLFEKGEGVLQSLFIAPVIPGHYLFSKVLVYSALATSVSLVVAVSTFGLGFNILLLTLAVLLTSAGFTFLGIAVVSRVKSINEYMMLAIPIMLPFMLPIIALFGLYEPLWFYLFPSYGAILLIHGSWGGISAGNALYGILILLVFDAACFFFAKKQFTRHIISQTGGAK